MGDEDYRGMLESKRFDIVQNLQVHRTFVLDYLRSKGVLDSEDCELIQSEKTTSQKIGKFVDILARKGPDGYKYLLESLQLENPLLYEKLTGQEASATTSPIMTKLNNSYLGVGEPLGNGELELLSKHLERTYGDLHEMSLKFEQVVQRKKSIEERLETTIYDLERNQEKVEHLQKQIDHERNSPSAPGPSNTNWVRCLQYMDTLRKEKSDRDIYIIALQTKLMRTKEEVDELQRKNDSLQAKNSELQKDIEDIRENYTRKKCESLRLSERIQRQGNEIKKAEEIQRKHRDLHFKYVKLREERDQLQEELMELHKWTEALKTHYDIVEYEKEKSLTSHTEIIAEFGSIQDELMRCREEMNEVQSVAADLRERVRHLEHDRQVYRKQRDGALTARREAMLDRDKAYLERDQAVKRFNELKASCEAKIENRILQLKNYDELVARNDVMEEEVKQLKIKLRQRERDLEEVNMKCGLQEECKDDDDDQNDSAATVPEIKVIACVDQKEDKAAGEPANQGENDQRPDDSGSPTSITLLLSSIKRRVNGMTSESPFFPRSEMEPNELFPSYTIPINFATFPPSNASFPDILRESAIHRKKPTRQPVRARRNSSEERAEDYRTFQEILAARNDDVKRKSGRPNRSSSDDILFRRDARMRKQEIDQPLERSIAVSGNSESASDDSTDNKIINFL